MRGRIFGRHALAVLALTAVTVAMAACGESGPQDREIELTMKDRQLDRDPAVISVDLGDRITLRITADENGTAHLHGHAKESNIGPGYQGTLVFEATLKGNFDLTFHPGAQTDARKEAGSGVAVDVPGSIFRSTTLRNDQAFSWVVAGKLEGLTVPYYNHLKRSRRGLIEVSDEGELSGTVEIDIVGSGSFEPAEISVKPGTTLVWTNYTEDRQMVSSGLVPKVESLEDEVILGSIEVQSE